MGDTGGSASELRGLSRAGGALDDQLTCTTLHSAEFSTDF